MSTQTVIPIGNDSVVKFDPKKTRIRDKALDLVIAEKRRILDWASLSAAIDQKIAEQREFLAWWEGAVTVRHGGDRSKGKSADRATCSLAEAEQLTGISHQQVSRWRRHLSDIEAYSAKLFGVTWKAAMAAKGKDTTALKWTGDPESYTPSVYIEAARAAMGAIDLDPASNALAQKTVKATCWYGEEEDGLTRTWAGRVFLNPPYAFPTVAHFIDKLCAEIKVGNVTTAVLLTNNNTDTNWWHQAMGLASAICFTSGRINFYKSDGTQTQPTNGQNFFYFGSDIDAFARAFTPHGLILSKL